MQENLHGEIGRLTDRFREDLRDIEKNKTDASKPVARNFNLLNTPTTTYLFAGYP